MINLHVIPTFKDWNRKTAEDFYPDDGFNIFFGKSYQETIQIFNQDNCIELTKSFDVMPIKPFLFYTACVISGISKQEIPINSHYSEFLLDSIIWSIDFKQDKIKSILLCSLIPLLEGLEIKLLSNDIVNSYTIDELNEVKNDLRNLINKLKVASLN